MARQDGDGRQDPSRSKVGRLIEEYGLTDFGTELERQWTGEGVEQRSLRELADRFNARLVQAAMERAGMSPLSGEPENVFRLLSGDEASVGERTQARRALEREGVDVHTLESDFVSHQAIHTYLTKYRGASRAERGERDAVEGGLERIQRLRSRAVTVSSHTIAHLRDTDRLDLGDFDVLLDLRVVCEECGTDYSIEELFAKEGCGCRRT